VFKTQFVRIIVSHQYFLRQDELNSKVYSPDIPRSSVKFQRLTQFIKFLWRRAAISRENFSLD